MSIVENLSRMNKQAAVQQDPNRLLVVPKAPGPINVAYSESLGELPVVRVNPHEDESPTRKGPSVRRGKAKANGEEPEENNYRNSLLLSGSVSAPSLPLYASTPDSSPGPSHSKPLPNPAKMPLRSALRNPSRTPSPNPPPASTFQSHSPPTAVKTLPAVVPTQPVPVPAVAPAPTVTTTLGLEPPPLNRRESDISSISSYETGREVFDDDEPSTPVSPPPADLQPQPQLPNHSSPQTQVHSSPQADIHAVNGSELSGSTDSTVLTGVADQPPRRRKSVRMSLPPTFSSTPPAIEDTDEDDAAQNRHAPWSSPGGGSIAPHGWGTRIEANGARDAWEDSSDEDAEYSAAKRLLARLSRKHER